MARGKKAQDTTLLSMALVGYESEMARIEEKIQRIHALMNGSKSGSQSAAKTTVKKRPGLSAAARKRIAAAQKKRWAAHRKALASAAGE